MPVAAVNLGERSIVRFGSKITIEGKNKHNMSQLLKDIYQQIKNNINPKHTIISIVNEEIVTKDVNIYLTSL